MNIASAEMLQNSLQNLGNTFYRQRELDQAKAMQERHDAIEQAYRDEQMKFAQDRADKQDQQNKIANKKEDNKLQMFGLEKATTDFSNAQNKMQDSMSKLANAVKTGAVSPQNATAAFKLAIDNGIGAKNPQLQAQLKNVPEFALVYNGQADWSKMADALSQQIASRSKTTTGAQDMMIQHWKEAQDSADAETDPDKKTGLQSLADMYEANLPATLKTTAPAIAPKPDETDTTIRQVPPPIGSTNNAPISLTNTVTKSFSLPPSASTGTATLTPQDMTPVTVAPTSSQQFFVPSFGSEAEARASGLGAGQVVNLSGIGKVRLK